MKFVALGKFCLSNNDVFCKFLLLLLLILILLLNRGIIMLEISKLRQFREVLNAMKSFLEVCEDTREKLNRQLQENEVEFLRWMHDRYTEEQEEKLEYTRQ